MTSATDASNTNCIPAMKSGKPVRASCSGANYAGSRADSQGRVELRKQFRVRSFSTISVSSPATPTSRHSNPCWRRSADLSGGGASPVIVVKKNMVRPEPPERGDSLSLRCPSKRHSCPHAGFPSPLRQPGCPPPVSPTCTQTWVITGPSPLGCRMRPKLSSDSSRARTARLSLQLPPSVTVPDVAPGPAANTDRAPKLKQPSRRHSETSAFLTRAVTHAITQEELGAVKLHPTGLLDDVFGEAADEEETKEGKKATFPQIKTPPLVPAKSTWSKWLARLIAESLRLSGSPGLAPEILPAKQEEIYAKVRKPKDQHSYKPADHSNGNTVAEIHHITREER